MAAKRKVTYIDSANNESYDPRTWNVPNMPANVGGRLTPTRVKVIRSLYAHGHGGYTLQELGDMFGVTGTTVYHVVNRVTWSWLA